MLVGSLAAWACGGDAVSLVPPDFEPPAGELPSGDGPGTSLPDDADGPGEPNDGATPELEQPAAPEDDGTANDGEDDVLGSVLPYDVVAASALELLETHCGSCHAGGASEGGFGDVLDIPKLIESGLIVPGSSDTSPLMALIRNGNMPPEDVRERLIDGELAVLGRFIDELQLPASPCTPLPFVSQDDLYAALLGDMASQPEAERPFIRYLGLTYASNAGLCGRALGEPRLALFKQLNSVSTAPEIHVPEAIDQNQLVYRIDLRDYRWDRAIDLEDDGSSDFADGWLAIVSGAAPYAVELRGSEANALRGATGTAVPFLPVNAFVHASAAGDLYYALIGARANVFDTQVQLGIEFDQAVLDGSAKRAGFVDFAPRRESSVWRVPQGASSRRYYWFLEQNHEQSNAESMFDSPLDREWGGEQAIFTLPNGLQAYLVGGPDGARRASLDENCGREVCHGTDQLNAASCHGCHSAGILPVVDVIRDYVEENERNFDRETFAAVAQIIPRSAEFAQMVQESSEVHLSALERAGIARSTPDPISRVFFQFEQQLLDVDQAAAELGTSAAALRGQLGRLHPLLSGLATPGAEIERASFEEAFVHSSCVLHEGAKNRRVGCP